ncbi:MAG TPA: glycerol kinase GlpK [Candidatus Dormibacteraeota bacterium]|nr:glycerol kinase GlpK [Candidatus Dormibacteraeota bacterium]
MPRRLVLALDQGTTSSRAIVFGPDGRPVASAQHEFPQGFPSPGHVTHDPEAIWESQLRSAREALEEASLLGDEVAAIGVANQRETVVVWEREAGRPVADAIVWQSRITAPACEALKAAGHEPLFRERTGLPLDAYFSGPKIAHILDAEPGLRRRAERGELAAGTVDSFLLWRLTGGRLHVTDVSNASRTLLFDIRRLAWDEELCRLVGVPPAVLPEVRSTSEVYGESLPELFGRAIPLASAAGDQQAALFGQACLSAGRAKNTYGTGAFLLVNTGASPVRSEHGLLTTVAWRLGDGPAAYALEGSVFVAGAAVQWLRDGLRAIERSADVEALARSAPDTGGVYLVPAFVGLGAPHWDPDARGLLIGLTRGTGLPQVARATVESIAYQVHDVLEAIEREAEVEAGVLRVDGGAAANDLLLQFQADLLGVPVERPVVTETTALGAAFLAGIATGVWSGPGDVEATWALDRRFEPSMDPGERRRLLSGWHRAVERSLGWAREEAVRTPDA